MNLEETSAEGEGFNFNQWLIQNDLLGFKQLFIKHGATSTLTLQVTAPEMQSMMADADFYAQPQQIPNLMTAIHRLAITVEKTVVTVVLSEKEQAVIDGIKLNLKSINEMEENVNRLKSEFPSNQQQIENMETQQLEAVASKINKKFDALFAALTQRKQSLLDQLNALKLKKENIQNVEELTVCTRNINDLRQLLMTKEKEYNELIAAEMDNVERQSAIIQIGHDVKTEIDAKLSAITKTVETMRKQIDQINTTDFVMQFESDQTTYDRMIGDIGRFGNITNRSVKIQSVETDDEKIEIEETSNHKPHLGLVVVGHVDSGKSTLCGRLLFELGAMSDRDLVKLRKEAMEMGRESFLFAFFMDKSRNERARGLTIRCCVREFFTESYHYTIIDAPGHRYVLYVHLVHLYCLV